MAHLRSRPFAAARAALPDGQWHRLLLKAGLAGVVALIFGWLLANRLADIPLADTRRALVGVTPGQWLGAICATIASFWAVGRYDGVIHRYLATGTAPRTARRAGAAAIAVSQTLGLGVITGAILRWRMVPGISLWQATKLTGFVAVFFLAGWASVTAITLVILPDAPFKGFALFGLLSVPPLVICASQMRRYRGKHWPNLFITTRLVALTALDTLTAALALWVLLPPDLALSFVALLPAFLIAFGAGLVSGTPGGVGAFEITLLALLPQVPEGPLLGAVLAWRVVYFAAPALIGAVVALRGPKDRPGTEIPPARPALAHTARRAETGLLAQGHLFLSNAGRDQAWLTGRTAHCLIGLLDPLLSEAPHQTRLRCTKLAIAALMDQARADNRLAVLYKCSARTAVAARSLGMKLRPVAREAWLDPRAFCLTTPSRAALRRKLRHADRAGVSVDAGASPSPQEWHDLARIAQDWAIAHGGERGFSMGRFDRQYLSTQRIYVATVAGHPVAFASFHIGKSEWTLDLMRHTRAAPDGTMHALIARALTDAAAHQMPRLSLAAVPLAALTPRPANRIAACLHRLLGGNHAGLAQFKQAFVPQWQTLYLVAPHRPGLALAGLEIAREVHFPRPLLPALHHHHEHYAFASAGQPWHTGSAH